MSEKINNTSYDLAIVGGGIIGMWVAKLARQRWPEYRILMLDQSLIGNGSTHYSLGMNYFYADTDKKQNMVLQSKTMWEELMAEIPTLPITKHPLVFFTSDEKKEMICSRFVGGKVTPLLPADIEAFSKNHPWFGNYTDNNVFSHGEAMRLSPEIVSALVQKLKSPSLHIYEGMKLVDLSHQDQEIQLFTASQQSFYTRKLVLAMGPWITKFLHPPKFRNKKIVTLHFDQLEQQAKTQAKTQSETADPILFWPEEPAFLVPNPATNQWILSFKAESWDSTPDINQLTITEQDLIKGFSFIDKYCPKLKSAFRGGRVFCDVYEDNIPTPQYLSENRNTVIVGAGSGIGFRLAPAIARDALEALENS